ncbi:protein translocase subunit SecDF [Subsaximicrobium wynnwilliamsii]|uniref:Multifunctional fusion protein n=1 Tax=Subsaximicrobium wynnwilliamsii TaxID=291179 RepID=A0A5C6ZLF1_9FLAO|nr:protein translocase subunit SecDF [Subsaximicrobium wynnwilliamsii]TXD84360.1 protein translocase subunit SecDF [Subsaximicrobium wynnwilliamsii]TXD90041.1 protein translocase subunit SecDF [Subsaximicrobium wynnwilliamsii]TXE04093.1 protein translocase subunit SecDF [Subsaximicrobium wynnwilliamsii]
MQNKGLVKLFALLFGLVSIYQLAFTFKSNQLDEDAKTYAVNKYDDPEQINDAEVHYMDSIANREVYDIGIATFTGNEVKEKAMNLGLDLKGGLNVILQISVRDILQGLSNNSKDPAFNKALTDAVEIQKDAQEPYLESFFTAWERVKGDKKLASPDIFANRNMDDVIDISMSDDDVKSKLEEKVDESIISAFEVLRKRIDQFGVTSPNIQRLGNSGRVLVELPGVKDIKRATELITTTAQLQFWDVETPQVLSDFFGATNETLKTQLGTETTETVTEQDSTATNQDSKIDDLLGETSTDSISTTGANPFFEIVGPPRSGGMLALKLEDKETMKSYLAMDAVRANLPAELRYTKFAFGLPSLDPETNVEYVDLYALKGNRDNEPDLSGGVVTDARQSYSQTNRPTVSMQMNAKGSKIWEEMTGRASAQGSQIAIVLDDIVYSAPTASNGAISGGNTEISGNFTVLEATDLANVLRAGKLPARAEIIQADQVGPSLGKEAIESGTKSFLLALSLVLIWMILYYGKAGLAADIALIFNIILIFGVLSGLGAVLTLPGLAGIVLTIGMSVDANVLIFERIREELNKGKAQKQAIKDGFSNALSSILDANITTGLTALILFIFGTGPIKGFATTLLIGIVTSLFTAIFITRLLVDWYANKNKTLDFSTSITKNLFKNNSINFIGKRKIAYVVSGIMIVVSLISLFTNKLDQGIDFVGGRTYQVRFPEAVNAGDVDKDLTVLFKSVEVKTIGGDHQLKISTKYKVDENSVDIDEEIQRMLYGGLESHLQGMSYPDFAAGKDGLGKVLSSKVSPTIADDIKTESFWAVLGSLLVVFLYILLRFKRWQFSLGAVAAVFHDVIILLGVFSLLYKFMPFSMEIDQAFIAAVLTVIGYSLNDTVVVFDRIREELAEKEGFKGGFNINTAINSTLSRTLNTSLTTLVVLFAMFLFGAQSLKDLLFALIVGVIIGTYSSVFIATPLMYDTLKDKGKAPEGEADNA